MIAFDLKGIKFNKLLVVDRIGSKNGKALWSCVCDCGNEIEVISANLTKNRVKSCGCYLKTGIYKNCEVCNKEIYIKKSHAEKEGKYCSRECMSVDYENLKGSKNPNYKHGLSYTQSYKKIYVDTWRLVNKDKVRQFNRNAKALRKFACGNYSLEDIKNKLCEQWNCCYWCFKPLSDLYDIDHVIPLIRGGSNSKNNIVISCISCNRQKWAYVVEEWLETKNCRCKRNVFIAGEFSIEWIRGCSL